MALIRVIISVYILTGILLFIFQRDFIYFPTEKTTHPFQSELFLIDGESINVIVLNSGRQDAIIYFGGNGESVARTAPDFSQTFSQQTLYLVNYRGYGGSSGSPTEQALYSDAQQIYDTLARRHRRISVIGRSLGTGVATSLASTRAIHKMVLITPYDSIQQMAQDRYPIYPMSLLLKERYDSFSRIKDVRAATLIILAEDDKIIPAKYSTRLIEAFPPSQITVEIIKGAGHNNLSHKQRYTLLLQQFI